MALRVSRARWNQPDSRWAGASLPIVLAALALVLAGVLALTADRGGTAWSQSPWFLIVEGALVNAALLAAVLWLRDGLLAKARLRAQALQELRHLKSWAAPEGVLRKAGLIRDLNAWGAVPGDLEGALLAGADLKGCTLAGANLRAADLHDADLQGAVLDGADLWGANLARANLAMASLKGAILRGCNLEGAALSKAVLTGAQLARANLINANLHGVNLTSAQLERARFAARDNGKLEVSVHPSVDDWIRARLDARGQYVPEGQSAEVEGGA